ncbi:hypothetical protein ID866_6319 [Astraeus odoratus]|nr:hypothetical protein ID866_6319 [Astraeus odoratus]
MRKPRSLVDNASAFLSSAVSAPLSFFSGGLSAGTKSTPEDVFSGDIDLTEDDVLEQDRGEEGEADDSAELMRRLRVLTIDPEDPQPEGVNARKRRQWEILALRTTAAHRRTTMKTAVAALLALTSVVIGQKQRPYTDNQETWLSKYGKQIDQPFSGPLSFSHLNYARCLEDESADFDIAVMGMPFDTGTTYRPGARFGPYAIRSGSRRQTRAYTLAWGRSPYEQGLKIIDCGDVPIVPFDNALAIDQIEVAYATLLGRPIPSVMSWKQGALLAKDGREHPRIVSMGGDHTIVLPILRALNKTYGPISIIHFDAHLDTWAGYPGAATEQSRITHGTFFYVANEEGLVSNSSIHAGIRCKLSGLGDIENDESVGFHFITSDDIDDYGVSAIIQRIKKRVGDTPVYLSLDIDVIDPGLAPGTGTPEAGGWTSREVKRIIRGLAGLNFVGVDVVEVAPAYDHAEITGTIAADIIHDILSLLVSPEPPKPPKLPGGWPRDEL